MTFDELHRLIKHGNVVEIRCALEGGLDPNLCNERGWTLLMLAAMAGDTRIGELLIERGAKLDVRTENIGHHNSALSLAVHSGHTGFVRLLLHKGASPDASPFHTTFDVFLDWAERYSDMTPEQAKNIRTLIEKERRHREVRA